MNVKGSLVQDALLKVLNKRPSFERVLIAEVAFTCGGEVGRGERAWLFITVFTIQLRQELHIKFSSNTVN